MGLSMKSESSMSPQYHIHKVFLFCNYILLGAASSCIFLTLSLRLFPSICGFFLILLHAFTIVGAVSAISVGTNRFYSAHMITTVLTAIFHGSVSVLVFTRTSDFLAQLNSYVREDDASVILKLAGGLTILIFCLEWVALTLAFFLKYYSCVDEGKVQQHEDLKAWPMHLQV
ncbi:hypothetical protein VNO77_01258 [Canavalia gladiata]|uniref:Uncharacterized protein n=1 Tax=Canavalia gladiata TaxID=3824 RepID=A0AAN9MXE8_CANGL